MEDEAETKEIEDNEGKEEEPEQTPDKENEDNQEPQEKEEEAEVPTQEKVKVKEFTAEEFLGKEIDEESLKTGNFAAFCLKDEDMYVSNPQLCKEAGGVKKYTSYTLQGNKVNEPVQRRFKDFFSLRQKLVERWPAVYIPNIPHKKIFGSKNEEVVEERIEMINEFCSKISKISYLYNGEEMTTFLKNDALAIKELEQLPNVSYEELLSKYENAFPDFDENFDFDDCKTEVLNLYHKLRDSLPSIQKFLDGINKAKDLFVQKKLDIYQSFKLAKKFEEDFLGNNVRNEELIFNNISKPEVNDKLTKYETFAKNTNTHYDNFYNKVLSHFLTIEALVECTDGFALLVIENEKMKKVLKDTEAAIEKNKAGTKSAKSMITFKSVEQDLNSLNEKKDELEKKINDLTNVIKITLFQLRKQCQAFKLISMDRFYKQYKLLFNDVKRFSDESDSLFNEIINHSNMKGVQINK